jgi:hypothetical protein
MYKQYLYFTYSGYYAFKSVVYIKEENNKHATFLLQNMFCFLHNHLSDDNLLFKLLLQVPTAVTYKAITYLSHKRSK